MRSATTPLATMTPSASSRRCARARCRRRARRGRDRAHRGGQPGAERSGVRGVRPRAVPRAAPRPSAASSTVFRRTSRTTSTSRACRPCRAPTRGPVAVPADGAFARAFLGTGLVPLGKTQMSEFGFSASAEHPRLGPVRNPWNPDYTAGASSSGLGGICRCRGGADRARQRRRRVDPDPGVLQRLSGSQADPGPLAAGQGHCARCRCRSSPTAW